MSNTVDYSKPCNIVMDQADLNKFVNLSVTIPKRVIDIMPESSDNEMSIDDIISGNEENKLSTSYVDISFSSDEHGIKNRELFGVTDIDIQFNTSFHPEVTINFTDIKGASLFNPSETSTKIAEDVFFGSLFNFPYPQFKLTIKGYLGIPCSFDLKVQNFDASFDSQTGNYNVTVKMIADKYGALTDIPMSLIMMAPLKKGKKDGVDAVVVDNSMWNYHFSEHVRDSEGKLIANSIPTFLEFEDKYNKFINGDTSHSTEKAAAMDSINKIDAITKKYNSLFNAKTQMKELLYLHESFIDESKYSRNNYKYKVGDKEKDCFIILCNEDDYSELNEIMNVADNLLKNLIHGESDNVKKLQETIKYFKKIQLCEFYENNNIKYDGNYFWSSESLCEYSKKGGDSQTLPGYKWTNSDGEYEDDIPVNDYGKWLEVTSISEYEYYNLNFNDLKKYTLRDDVYDNATFVFKSINDNKIDKKFIYEQKFKRGDLSEDAKTVKKCYTKITGVSGNTYSGQTATSATLTRRNDYDYIKLGGYTTYHYRFYTDCGIDQSESIFRYIFGELRQKYYDFIQECKNKVYFYIIPKEFSASNIDDEMSTLKAQKENTYINNIGNIEKYFKVVFGFSPTIKNICEMTFAHLDCFSKVLKGIYSQCIKQDRIATLGNVKIDYNYSGNSVRIPPFASYAVNDNNNVLQLKYPEEIVNDKIKSFSEVAYVNDLVDIVILKKNNEDLETNSASYSAVFKQTLPSDIVLDYNPYLIKSINKEEISKHIFKVLGMRMRNSSIYGNISTLSGFWGVEKDNLLNVLESYKNAEIFNQASSNIGELSEGFLYNLSEDYMSMDYFNIDKNNAWINQTNIKNKRIFKYKTTFNPIILPRNTSIEDTVNKTYAYDYKNTNNEPIFDTNFFITNDSDSNGNFYTMFDTYYHWEGTDDQKEFERRYVSLYLNHYQNKRIFTLEQGPEENCSLKWFVEKVLKKDMSTIDRQELFRYIGFFILNGKCRNIKPPFVHTKNYETVVTNKSISVGDGDNGSTYSIYKNVPMFTLLKISSCEWGIGKVDTKFYPYTKSTYTKKYGDGFEDLFLRWTSLNTNEIDVGNGVKIHTLAYYVNILASKQGSLYLVQTANYKKFSADDENGCIHKKVTLLNVSENKMEITDNYDDTVLLGTIKKDVETKKEATGLNVINNAQIITQTEEFNKELKKNIYYELKNIGDKYIYDICRNRFDMDNKMSNNYRNKISVVDSFMNDITGDSYLDISEFYNIIKTSEETSPSLSVMQFITRIAESNKYLFITMPSNFKMEKEGNESLTWDNIFRPLPWGAFESEHKIGNYFIFMQQNEDAHTIGASYTEDYLTDNSMYKNMHTFDVNFGEQNNGVIKSINMNMQDSISTEETINTTLMIVGSASHDGKTLERRGMHSLFDIYKSRSYKVSMEMMGNVNITPLLFFNLKNIPMYNGIYRIINVSHKITPNDFSTSIVGVRVGKYGTSDNRIGSSMYNLVTLLNANKGGTKEETKKARGKVTGTHKISPPIEGCSDSDILSIVNSTKRREKFFECYDSKFTPIHVTYNVSLSSLKNKKSGKYPVSIRQYNPGNIIKTKAKWCGEVDSIVGDNRAFKRFKNAKIGYFHIFALLFRYNKIGTKKIKDIIYKWCPVAQSGGGLDTQTPKGTYTYICRAMAHTNKGANEEIDVNNSEDMINLAICKTRVEGGAIDINQKIYDNNFILDENNATKSLKDAIESAWELYLLYGKDESKVRDVNFDLGN